MLKSCLLILVLLFGFALSAFIAVMDNDDWMVLFFALLGTLLLCTLPVTLLWFYQFLCWIWRPTCPQCGRRKTQAGSYYRQGVLGPDSITDYVGCRQCRAVYRRIRYEPPYFPLGSIGWNLDRSQEYSDFIKRRLPHLSIFRQ